MPINSRNKMKIESDQEWDSFNPSPVLFWSVFGIFSAFTVLVLLHGIVELYHEIFG